MPFVVMPYRNPLLAAKMLATIDVLSNGRLDILLGVGWNREESRALMVPTPFDKRGAVTNEYLRAFVTLWNDEYPEFQGKHLQFSDVEFAPKPVQQPPSAVLDRRRESGGHPPRRETLRRRVVARRE